MIIRRMYYNLILLKNISEKDLHKIVLSAVAITNDIRDLDINDISYSLINEVNIFKKTISK
jgi:hypothetical protein